MKLLGFFSTTVLSLTLGAAVPVYAQDQHDQQEEKKEKPVEQKEKKTQQDKPARPEQRAPQQQEKNAKQEQKAAQQQDKNAKQEQKAAQRQDKNTREEQGAAQQQHKAAEQQHNAAQHEEQNAHPQQQHQAQAKNEQGHGGGGRIPEDRYRAHFGNEHRFRVTESNYRQDRRFQYGGYWFGFVDPWPTNWLYTQDVFVIEIDGVYYLCNPAYPGVNVALSVTL